MSILGVVTLISSLVMVVIGLMWLHHSKQKLIKKWTRREESRQNKVNLLNFYILFLAHVHIRYERKILFQKKNQIFIAVLRRACNE